MSAVAQSLQHLETEFASGSGNAETDSAGGDAREFVTFHMHHEMFALPLANVLEIIRMPNVARVPLSPPALAGLANLRGTVLPVVDLRRMLGLGEAVLEDSTRVIVLDHGRPVGLVVDRMANVITVEADRIEPTGQIRGTVDDALLTGFIKAADGTSMIMILDARCVIEREFRGILGAGSGDGQFDAPSADARGSAAIGAEAVEEDQLVSFIVANQEYAFPIENVREIVQLPETVNSLPNVPYYVLGLITLRDRLLPLVSLRALFGLPPAAVTEASKVVVISLGGGDNLSVGVVMDNAKEVLRVSHALIEPLPQLLASGGDGGITAICRMEEGRRLVSILSPSKMFNTQELRQALSAEEDLMTDRPDGARDEISQDISIEEQFVAFRLMGEEYAVPIEAVQEIVRVPDKLTHMPKAPSFVEGVINLRGTVLPVVDQRRRFGLEPAERNDRQRIMVFAMHGVRTGFIVDSVSEVMRIQAKAIGPAPHLSEEQSRVIRRVANLEEDKRMILLIEVAELLNAQEMSEPIAQAA
jgi:purine-binding chemotaxis protein CheW